LRKAVLLASQTLHQTHLQPVQLGLHGLQVKIRLGILSNADGGFHQGKVIIALHQGRKILQGRGVLVNRPAHRLDL
jgi:hypothetical protein